MLNKTFFKAHNSLKNGLGLCLLSLASCSETKSDTITPTTTSETVVNVLSTNFLTAGLTEPISIVSRTLSNGTTANCYKIVTKSTPTDHSVDLGAPPISQMIKAKEASG